MNKSELIGFRLDFVCFLRSALVLAFQRFTRKHCFQIQAGSCVVLREIDFLLKICCFIRF